MAEWGGVIWFVAWALAILAGLGIIAWIAIAAVMARSFKKATKDFDKGFGSDFFTNSHRR